MAKKFENPLIRNARMREMYVAMVEGRMLAKHLRRASAGLGKGLEACWVATAIDLRDGDLTSDAGAGPVPGYVRNGERSKAKVLKAALAAGPVAGRLDAVDDPVERLWCAVGAGLALKAAVLEEGETRGVVVAYARAGELKAAEWKRVLAGAKDAPVVFVLLPDEGDSAAVAELAGKCGVPGIPVDAADAVAIYRVAQESIVRARADGVAALIAAVRLDEKSDPVKVLGEQIIAKQVASAAWVGGVVAKFQKRMAAGSVRVH